MLIKLLKAISHDGVIHDEIGVEIELPDAEVDRLIALEAVELVDTSAKKASKK